ncbi:MAG: dTMP kinase [Planctomycetota bacterium]|nr:MAG: dTMP kinase [Planctomycetota bacterium]
MFVAFEGIDGSGKGTQARMLAERLQAVGTTCQVIAFPRYGETRFGRAISDYLNGAYGDLHSVHPVLASVLYAGDRFESRELLQSAAARNAVVILDRFTASNVAHQAAKLPEPERPAFIQWITGIEHDVFGMPHPDVTVLLDIEPELAQRRVSGKAPRGYTHATHDLHESDRAYLAEVRRVYLQLAEREPNWYVVAATDGEGRPRSPDQIAARIWDILVSHRRTGG